MGQNEPMSGFQNRLPLPLSSRSSTSTQCRVVVGTGLAQRHRRQVREFTHKKGVGAGLSLTSSSLAVVRKLGFCQEGKKYIFANCQPSHEHLQYNCLRKSLHVLLARSDCCQHPRDIFSVTTTRAPNPAAIQSTSTGIPVVTQHKANNPSAGDII